MHSLNLLEIATSEKNAINQQFEHAKQKLAKYKLENQAAIELYNEQMTILCNFLKLLYLFKNIFYYFFRQIQHSKVIMAAN